MRIRPNNQTDQAVVYADGVFNSRDEFVIKQPDGATPFGGLLCCPGSDYSVEVAPDGRNCSYHSNQPLTPPDGSGKAWYIRDAASGEVWSPFPHPTNQQLDEYEIRCSPGQMTVYSLRNKIACTLTIAAVPGLPCEVWLVKLCNLSAQDRMLTFTTYSEPHTGQTFESSSFDNGRVMLLRQPLEVFAGPVSDEADTEMVFFQSSTLAPLRSQVEKSQFIGEKGSLAKPEHITRDEQPDCEGVAGQAVIAMTVEVDLPIEGEAEFGFAFGAAHGAEKAFETACKFTNIKPVVDAVRKSRWSWKNLCSHLNVETPDPVLNALVNTWLPYEAYADWVSARNATPYVSPEHIADDLRRVYSLTPTAPEVMRGAIVAFASRLSVIGAYYVSEDLAVTIPPDEQLWLALCTANYIVETGDAGILAEGIPLRDGPRLTLREHCERAIRTCLHSGKGQSDLTDRVIRLWESVTGETVEFGLYLRHNGESDYSSQKPTSQRLRYLQSLCPTLAERCVTTALNTDAISEQSMPCTLYTALTESLLGVTASAQGLALNPDLPRTWSACEITRRWRGETYKINITRADGLMSSGLSISQNGLPVYGSILNYKGDGGSNEVDAIIG